MTIIILYGQIAPVNNVYSVSKKNTTIWLNQIQIPNLPVVFKFVFSYICYFLVTYITLQKIMTSQRSTVPIPYKTESFGLSLRNCKSCDHSSDDRFHTLFLVLHFWYMIFKHIFIISRSWPVTKIWQMKIIRSWAQFWSKYLATNSNERTADSFSQSEAGLWEEPIA